jgi:hypothetical protein
MDEAILADVTSASGISKRDQYKAGIWKAAGYSAGSQSHQNRAYYEAWLFGGFRRPAVVEATTRPFNLEWIGMHFSH